jgi:hypothetical protein
MDEGGYPGSGDKRMNIFENKLPSDFLDSVHDIEFLCGHISYRNGKEWPRGEKGEIIYHASDEYKQLHLLQSLIASMLYTKDIEMFFYRAQSGADLCRPLEECYKVFWGYLTKNRITGQTKMLIEKELEAFRLQSISIIAGYKERRATRKQVLKEIVNKVINKGETNEPQGLDSRIP